MTCLILSRPSCWPKKERKEQMLVPVGCQCDTLLICMCPFQPVLICNIQTAAMCVSTPIATSTYAMHLAIRTRREVREAAGQHSMSMSISICPRYAFVQIKSGTLCFWWPFFCQHAARRSKLLIPPTSACSFPNSQGQGSSFSRDCGVANSGRENKTGECPAPALSVVRENSLYATENCSSCALCHWKLEFELYAIGCIFWCALCHFLHFLMCSMPLNVFFWCAICHQKWHRAHQKIQPMA
jgi:hypothetical protein